MCVANQTTEAAELIKQETTTSSIANVKLSQYVLFMT